MNSWPEYISRETAFLKAENIDLVISDIVPQAFVASAEAKIPSIAISNFTWHHVFSELFGEGEPDVIRLKKAYGFATMALILPFNEPMEVFGNKKEIALIARKVTDEDLRLKMEISDEFVIFLNVLNAEDRISRSILEIPGVKFVLPFNSTLNISNSIKIPKSETESQNWIAMCNLVVTKAGYSTVSEAVSNGIYLLILRREGFREDEWIINNFTENGFGEEISIDELYKGDWILKYKCKSNNVIQNKNTIYKNIEREKIVDEIGGFL